MRFLTKKRDRKSKSCYNLFLSTFGIYMKKQLCSLLSSLLLVFQALLICQGNEKKEDEIKITLKSDQPLFMAYIPAIENKGAEFSQAYLDSLRNVLLFDFNNNGSTYIPDSSVTEKLNSLLSAKEPLPTEALSKEGLAYLIQLRMSGKVLEPKLVQVLSNASRSISGITCTGNLNEDRKKLHELSSFIHQVLFNTSSIATSRLIWVCKHKKEATESSEPKYTSEIVMSDYDGFNRKQLSPHMDTLVTTPLWIPRIRPGYIANTTTSSRETPLAFAFISYQLGQAKLYFSPLASFKPIRVSTLKGNQMTPAVSSDGTRMAFCCDTTGTSDLYMVEFNQATGGSSKPRQLYRFQGSVTGCPTFSPDGKQIAFVSNKDGSPKIYVIDIPPISAKLKDIKPKLLTKRNNENTAPAWSPDGKKIAYSARSGKESRQIWILDCTSGRETKVTDGEGDKESPAWAANSQHLTYHSTLKDGTSSIYLLSLRKPTPVCIVSGKEAFQFASWEPLKDYAHSN